MMRRTYKIHVQDPVEMIIRIAMNVISKPPLQSVILLTPCEWEL
jgi:hypothetical protein